MKILHICNDFTGSKVHAELYRRLDMLGIKQTVYTYYDGSVRGGKNGFDALHTDFVYDDILSRRWRKLYPFKELYVASHLRKKINPRNYDCICATTMMSDGGVAYLLSKIYHIPYVVAVRATDIYTFLEKKLSWPFARTILLDTKRIIIVAKSHQVVLSEHPATKKIWECILDKILIQPNGIDEFWHQNISRKSLKNNHSLCYVGNFNIRKNVSRLIDAVVLLKERYPDIQLNLIGERGTQFDEVMEKVCKYEFVHYLGSIYDKVKLKEVFLQNSVFAMPSIHETFGLVYLEALSQNLRLLYTKGQGIDGLFEKVGIAVDPLSVNNIANGIEYIFNHFDELGNSEVEFSDFDWDTIANRYVELYKKVIGKV